MNEKLLYSIDILLFIIYWNGDMTGLPQAKNKKTLNYVFRVILLFHHYIT
jgi:hypothetical protein